MAANTLGRYHIIREIARSNDIVYEAMDPAQGKKIALKELQIAGNLVGQGRRERIERFTREARSAHRLKHPNIVRILDHGQAQGRYYIAMEYLEGQSLRDVIRQRGTMPLQEALRIATCVAEGLEYAHKNGVVHRDIKPDNVHLEPDGRVVITDFGIARITFEPSLTADGQIFGTPSYMSPEQVTGKGIDKRSDVFSLGVMLYEMVAGRKPFIGDSVITITYNIMNVEPGPIVGAPAGVEQVVRKAIAKDPSRRYQSAAEFVEDLQLVARGNAPRHAMAAPAPASRSSAPPAGRPASPPPSRPMPGPSPAPGARPVFGAGAGGYQPPANPGPVHGARPLPPAPWGANGHGRQNGAPPAAGWGGQAQGYPPHAGNPYPPQGGGYPPPGGYPPQANGYPPPANGYPQAPGAPQSFPAARPARAEGGFDVKWFMGWLAIAVVIAGIILTVVWASVTAYDKFRVQSASISATKTQQTAEEAFRQGRFEEALNGYLQAMKEVQGPQLAIVKGNAARSATEVAQAKVKEGKGADAEKFARQAVEINPDSAKAHIALGQSLGLQGNVDAASTAFDDAAAVVARMKQGSGTDADKTEAADAADKIPLWKADVLYNDAVRQMTKNPMLAQQRFEAVINAAPTSVYAKNSRVYLLQLRPVTGAGAPGLDPADLGITPGGSTPDPGAPAQPSGWDNSYRQGFPNPSSQGGTPGGATPGAGAGLPPPLGRF